MYNVFQELSRKNSARYKMIISIKFLTFSSILVSLLAELFFNFKFLNEDNDLDVHGLHKINNPMGIVLKLKNFKNFTCYLVKLNTIFCFVLDLILGFTYDIKEFSLNFMLYFYINKYAKVYLYGMKSKRYLLFLTVLPMTLMESLHYYVNINNTKELTIKLRYYSYRFLLPINLIGDILSILNIEHHSTFFICFLIMFLIVFFLVELYDHYHVSNVMYREYKNYLLLTINEKQELLIKKDQ